MYQLYIAYLCYAFEGHILHLTRHLWLPRMALGPNIIFHHRREMLRAIRCRILMFEIFQFTRRKIWKGSSDWYKWLKGAVKNVFRESFPKCMNPPTLSGPLTHPRVLWDLGKRKVKFGSKKAIFGVIWGVLRGFDLVWESATPPTYIWGNFPKKTFSPDIRNQIIFTACIFLRKVFLWISTIAWLFVQ